MSKPLDVLLVESRPYVGEAAAAALRAGGHRVHHCHERGSRGFPCKGITDPGSCPLDLGVDVVLAVRRRVRPNPTPLEGGVICAVRAGVPVVEDGPVVLDPFEPWLAARADGDVVSACERVAGVAFGPDVGCRSIEPRLRPGAVVADAVGSGGLRRWAGEGPLALVVDHPDRHADEPGSGDTGSQEEPGGIAAVAVDPGQAGERKDAVMSEVHDLPVEVILEELHRDECVALLRTQRMGRLAVADHGHYPPHIVPVNFALEADCVVFRCNTGLKFKLSVLAQHSVSFEVDSLDEAGPMAWSVVFQGRAELLGGDEIETFSRAASLRSWAPGERGQWVRLIPYTITGRRLRTVHGSLLIET